MHSKLSNQPNFKCSFPNSNTTVVSTTLGKSSWLQNVLEEVFKKTWPPIDLWAGPRQSEALHHLPCAQHVRFPHCSHSGSSFQGHNLERAMCCWDYVDGIHTWTPVRPLMQTLKMLAGRGTKLLVMWLPATSLRSKFPCLLKLPIWNGLPLPSVSPFPLSLGPGCLVYLGSPQKQPHTHHFQISTAHFLKCLLGYWAAFITAGDKWDYA